MPSNPTPDNSGGIHIVGVGACVAVGANSQVSAAAVRAKLSRFETVEIGQFDEPAPFAKVTILPEGDIIERMKAMLTIAVVDAMMPLTKDGDEEVAVPLYVGLPSARPGLGENLTEELRNFVTPMHGKAWRVRDPHLGAHDHVSGILGLAEATSYLANEQRPRVCLVTGVDSFLSPETLLWLREAERIDRSDDCFIPGEGAGACLLANQRALKDYSLPSLGKVIGLGSALEEATRDSEQPNLGLALTQSIVHALDAAQSASNVTRVLADLNCEKYRTDEWIFCLSRLSDRLAPSVPLVQPSYSWGDVGAASGPLLLMLAVSSRPKAGTHLIFVGSDTGERACAIVSC